MALAADTERFLTEVRAVGSSASRRLLPSLRRESWRELSARARRAALLHARVSSDGRAHGQSALPNDAVATSRE